MDTPTQDGYYWFVGEIGNEGVSVREPEVVEVRTGSVWRHGLDIGIPLTRFRGDFTGPLMPPASSSPDTKV